MTDARNAVTSEELAATWAASIQAMPSDLSPLHRGQLRSARLVALNGDTARVAVASSFDRQLIETKLLDTVVDALLETTGNQWRLAVVVDERLGGLDGGLDGTRVLQFDRHVVDLTDADDDDDPSPAQLRGRHTDRQHGRPSASTRRRTLAEEA